MELQVKVDTFLKSLKPFVEVATKGITKGFADSNKLEITAGADGIEIKSFGGCIAISSKLTDLDVDGLNYLYKSGGTITVNATDLVTTLSSFEDGTLLTLKLNQGAGKELEISKVGDNKELQTLPLYDDTIVYPKLSKKFEKEVKIKREVLLNAIDRIIFAISSYNADKRFVYWYMKYDQDKVNFVTGSGMRFATLNISGKDFIETKDKGDFIFHRDQTPTILSVLKSTSEDYVVIKESTKTDDIPGQMVLSFGSTSILVVGFDPDIKRYDEGIFLKRPKTCKFVTKVSDWIFPMKGIRATYNSDVKKAGESHEAEMVMDVDKKTFAVKTSTSLKSNRSIPVIDLENTDANVKQYQITSLSQYLAEVPSYLTEGGYCQVELGANVDPIVIQDYASEKVLDKRPNGVNSVTGLTEEFSIIIAVIIK